MAPNPARSAPPTEFNTPQCHHHGPNSGRHRFPKCWNHSGSCSVTDAAQTDQALRPAWADITDPEKPSLKISPGGRLFFDGLQGLLSGSVPYICRGTSSHSSSPKRGMWVIPNCSSQSRRLALSATRSTHDRLEFRQIPLDVSGNPQSVLCSCELIKSFVRQRSRHDEPADLMGRSERKDSEHDDRAQKRPEGR
jgi:hypothetical protein